MSGPSRQAQAPAKTGGPLVSSGPRKGRVRSRTVNGRWRKKRADAGVPRNPRT